MIFFNLKVSTRDIASTFSNSGQLETFGCVSASWSTTVASRFKVSTCQIERQVCLDSIGATGNEMATVPDRDEDGNQAGTQT